MFGFLKKPKKGNIEKKFGHLSLEQIVFDLSKDSLTTRMVALGLCRLAIYGGLNLKKLIDSQKLLKEADPDRIVIEGIAFTWSHIFRECLKSSNVDIYEDEELADAVYGCSVALHSVLDEYTSFEIKKNYIAPYANSDLIKSIDSLTGHLLAHGNVEMLGDIKDHLGTVSATNIYATTMLPSILKASISLLQIYLKVDDDYS